MQAAGGFPIDLILFAMIAAFLVLRLRSILGKRTGFDGVPQAAPRPMPRSTGPVIDVPAEPVAAARPLPEPDGLVGRTLAEMRVIDRKFDPALFITGAEHAFRQIVTAFAAGDRVKLRTLLADDAYRAFEGAIAARETAGHAQRTDVRAIHEATITGATLSTSLATIVVRFVSDQVNLTSDADLAPVAGTDAVTEIHDLWTFQRDLAQPDLTWRLTEAHSA